MGLVNQYANRMKSVPLIALIGLLLATSLLPAAEGRVIKVLPHLFDSQGRHSLSPSLYERDALLVWQLSRQRHRCVAMCGRDKR
jgi:hypothetical protein